MHKTSSSGVKTKGCRMFLYSWWKKNTTKCVGIIVFCNGQAIAAAPTFFFLFSRISRLPYGFQQRKEIIYGLDQLLCFKYICPNLCCKMLVCMGHLLLGQEEKAMQSFYLFILNLLSFWGGDVSSYFLLVFSK